MKGREETRWPAPWGTGSVSSRSLYFHKGLDTQGMCNKYTERKNGQGREGGAEKECREAQHPLPREGLSAEGNDSSSGWLSGPGGL